MGLVTAYCPLTVVQTAGETRFVVDCKVKPVALVSHVKITLVPAGVMVSCGAVTVPDERRRTIAINAA